MGEKKKTWCLRQLLGNPGNEEAAEEASRPKTRPPVDPGELSVLMVETSNQWELTWILKWVRALVTVRFQAIFWGEILHKPYIGLIDGKYLQFRFLKWPLINGYKY